MKQIEQKTLTYKQYRYLIYEPSTHSATLRNGTGDIGGGAESLVLIIKNGAEDINREEVL